MYSEEAGFTFSGFTSILISPKTRHFFHQVLQKKLDGYFVDDGR